MSEAQKTAVIFGLANKRSIAWAIAQKLQQAGWRLAITYQNERLALEAKDLIAELPGAAGFMCDVTQDDQIARLFVELKEKYGVLQGLVHSIGFAPEADLKGEFFNTTREGFRIAHDISVYSLIAVCRGALPLMTSGGGIVTLTYYGAQRPRPPKYSRQRHLRRSHQDFSFPRHLRLRRHAQSASRARPSQAQRRCRRSRCDGSVLAFRSGLGDHRRNDLRGLRLQHHGILKMFTADSSQSTVRSRIADREGMTVVRTGMRFSG